MEGLNGCGMVEYLVWWRSTARNSMSMIINSLGTQSTPTKTLASIFCNSSIVGGPHISCTSGSLLMHVPLARQSGCISSFITSPKTCATVQRTRCIGIVASFTTTSVATGHSSTTLMY